MGLDLQLLVVFLENFNGFKKCSTVHWSMNDTFDFYTDSSGAYWCVVVFVDEWSWLAWQADWSQEIKKRYSFSKVLSNIVKNFFLGR